MCLCGRGGIEAISTGARMNTVNELVAIKRVAQQLEDQGYVVAIEPEPTVIPFPLGGYRPDILATRGAENIIVEVKSKRTRRALEEYKHVLDAVRQHAGWRFMLSTVDDEEPPST